MSEIKKPDIYKMNLPADLKKLSTAQCEELCGDIRKILIDTVSKNGGHLASNLGTVELTMAIHRVFESPKDKIVWDVGHQAYTHKILTGRLKEFKTLRQENGISGFCRPDESVHDAFISGHSSTSVSAALGIATAMKLSGDKTHHAIAVVGDGASTGGELYEGLNNAGKSDTNIIVILNYNEMSISKNVGGMAKYLSSMRTKESYQRTKGRVERMLDKTPVIGKPVKNAVRNSKNAVKNMILHSTMFEDLGFHYIGPIDGHNLEELEQGLMAAKAVNKPVFVHVNTIKGKGYAPAEANPGEFHGVGSFEIKTGNPDVVLSDSFSSIMGKELCEMGEKNKRLCAVTAAMKYGTGLQYFAKRFPERFFDVGIAEEHAVTFCAGLASMNYVPVFAVYSTFLQRGYDQLLHDVCLQKLPVVFGIDRAGLVGADGETHQGVYDIAYFSTLPRGIKLFSPSSTNELCAMLDYALTLDMPCAIRYNRGLLPSRECSHGTSLEDWEIIKRPKCVTVAATGRLLQNAAAACEGLDVGLVNARLLCPIEEKHIELFENTRCLITVEDGNADTGFGAQMSRLAAAHGKMRVVNLGVPNIPIEAASIAEQDDFCGLTTEKLRKVILEAVESVRGD